MPHAWDLIGAFALFCVATLAVWWRVGTQTVTTRERDFLVGALWMLASLLLVYFAVR